MPTPYRIFGNELSPYSVKVRSYFRYKQLPHEWIVRNPTVEEEFSRYAKLPLIPLVVTPDGHGLQDSTPIIEHLEAAHPRAVDPSGRSGARLHLGADRGVRRRVGQQADVPLPLVLRGRSGVGRRATGAQHDARAGRDRAAERRRHDQGGAWCRA